MAPRYFLIMSALCFLSTNIYAQDSITVKDMQEIRYKAEVLVRRELQDLLNNIAQPGFDSKETEEIINNSYGGNNNKIFYSDKTRIESDLNPKIHHTADASDIDVVKYLKDFDILYTKTDNFSIAFSDIRVSQVKKATYLYVKVYFSSFFNSKYKGVEAATPYTLNNRVAEIKIINSNNKWIPYIAGISFFEPADTLNDLANDIAIQREPGAQVAGSIDSAAAASIDAEIEAKKRKQLMDEENTQTQKFNKLINDGDKALDANNFTDALNYYNQAKDLMPYDPLPRNKLRKAIKVQHDTNVSKDQLFEQYIENARLATRNREYEEAIRSYRSALDSKPTEKQNLQAEIEALTKKVNFLTEMNLNYKAGNYKEAIKQYSAAIKKKKDSDYFLGRARSYVKSGEYDEAMKDFTTAYELDNENLAAIEGRSDLHKFLGDAVVKAKKVDDKKEHYIKALTGYTSYLPLNKKNLHIYEAISELQMLLYNNIDDAIKALDAGLDADLKSKPLYIKKGLLLIRKKDFAGADVNFTSALKIDSSDAFAYYNRGLCQLNMNNTLYASVYFANARSKKLDSLNLTNISRYADSLFHLSATSFTANEKETAMNFVNDAIAIDPTNSGYHYAKGEYYTSLHNYKEAIESYSKAIDLGKNYTDAYYKRGVSYYSIAEYTAAIADLKKASAQGYAQLYKVQKGLGDAYLAVNDYSNATQNFEQSIKTAGALKNDPPNAIIADIYNAMGKAYFHLNMQDKAIDAYKSAIKKNNALDQAYYNIGMAYNKIGKPQDAIENINKAVSLNNKKTEWLYQLALYQQTYGDFSSAINNYNILITADTAYAFPNAIYYRGLAYYEAGDYNNALPDYIKYGSATRDSVPNTLQYQLGNIYLNLGRYDSAIVCFQKILSGDQANGSAMYGIGSSLFLKGKKEEALPWFEKSFQTKSIQSADVKKDKLIAGLKNEKDFKALMKKYF